MSIFGLIFSVFTQLKYEHCTSWTTNHIPLFSGFAGKTEQGNCFIFYINFIIHIYIIGSNFARKQPLQGRFILDLA